MKLDGIISFLPLKLQNSEGSDKQELVVAWVTHTEQPL